MGVVEMKRLILMIMACLFLVACGSEEVAEVNKDIEDVKASEMNENDVKAYTEKITSKYILAGVQTVEAHKEEYVAEGIADVNIAIFELEEFVVNNEEKQLTLKLARDTKKALLDMSEGKVHAEHDNAHDVGKTLGIISEKFMDGDLPSTYKVIMEE